MKYHHDEEMPMGNFKMTMPALKNDEHLILNGISRNFTFNAINKIDTITYAAATCCASASLPHWFSAF